MAGLARMCRFNSRIQGQQVSLFGDFRNTYRHLINLTEYFVQPSHDRVDFLNQKRVRIHGLRDTELLIDRITGARQRVPANFGLVTDTLCFLRYTDCVVRRHVREGRTFLRNSIHPFRVGKHLFTSRMGAVDQLQKFIIFRHF